MPQACFCSGDKISPVGASCVYCNNTRLQSLLLVLLLSHVVQPCLKVAWDFYKPEEFSLYVKVWREVACPYFKPVMDYMGVQAILHEAINNPELI